MEEAIHPVSYFWFKVGNQPASCRVAEVVWLQEVSDECYIPCKQQCCHIFNVYARFQDCHGGRIKKTIGKLSCKEICNTDKECKERKPCVKWINDNTFLAISDFSKEKRVYTRAKTLEDSGSLRTSSGIFGNDRVVFKIPGTARTKISRLYLRKSWQV